MPADIRSGEVNTIDQAPNTFTTKEIVALTLKPIKACQKRESATGGSHTISRGSNITDGSCTNEVIAAQFATKQILVEH